jgi:hypothetical protein
MVEPAYASLTVEPAYASLSVEPPKGTESLTIHMVRVRKHTRLSRPPSFELSLIFLTSFGGPISIKEAHSTVQERDGVTHYSYGEGPLLSLMVEYLKVLNSRACLRILISRVTNVP